MDWNVITRQFLAGQGSATRAPGAGPATTGRASTLPPELSSLPPQLIAALLSTLASNSAEPEPELDSNPNSDANRRTRMVFKFGQRPVGTAGRGEFNIQHSLGLNDDDYDLITRTIRQICVLCHFDMDLAITKQHPDKVVRARAKVRKAFPGLAPFSECKVPHWPINGLLLVVMKASSQGAQRREKRRERERAATNAHSAPNPVVPVASATPAGDEDEDDDEDDDMVGDMTMASVKELDGMDDDEETDEDSSDSEKVDDATALDPPAYNPDPVPTVPAAVLAAPRTTRKTTPAPTANSRASSLAPAVQTNVPASTLNNATPVPVNPPAPVSNSRGGRRRRATAGTASTPATIAPTSTTAIATAIAAPATTNTTVQAQASATTGLPLDLADAFHLACLPASKRPLNLSTPGPTDAPAVPAAKLKKGAGAASTTTLTDTAQSTSSSKSKAKAKKTPEPAADAEAMGLSGPESEPVTKVTRRRGGKGAASGATLEQDQQKPANKKGTKAKAPSSSATAAGEAAPKAKTKKK